MPCSKRKYNYKEATKIVERMKTHSNKNMIISRSYFCEICKAHHLTKSDGIHIILKEVVPIEKERWDYLLNKKT